MEYHTSHRLSETTKNRITEVMNNRRAMTGGNISTPGPLSGFDYALLRTLSMNIPIANPKVKGGVMNAITYNGQTILPGNSNIYYSYLLNDRKALADTVNQSLDTLKSLRGGEMVGNMIPILAVGAGVFLVILLALIGCYMHEDKPCGPCQRALRAQVAPVSAFGPVQVW